MLTRVLLAVVLVCGSAATVLAEETEVRALGVADHAVTAEELTAGEAPSTPHFNTPGVAYALVAGAKTGDVIEVALVKDGKPLMSNSQEVEADGEAVLVQAGKRGVPAGGWPDGSYSASVTVTRGGKPILQETSEATPFD